MEKEELTPKQYLSIQHMIPMRNATQAALAAGYEANSAYQSGYLNMKNYEIRKQVEQGWSAILEAKGLTPEVAIEELRSLGFWNIQDFLTEKNAVADLSQLPRSTLRPVLGRQGKGIVSSGRNPGGNHRSEIPRQTWAAGRSG